MCARRIIGSPVRLAKRKHAVFLPLGQALYGNGYPAGCFRLSGICACNWTPALPLCLRAAILSSAGAESGIGTAAASVPRGAHREPERHNSGQKSRRSPAGMHCIHLRSSQQTCTLELAGQKPPRNMVCAESADGCEDISFVADEANRGLDTVRHTRLHLGAGSGLKERRVLPLSLRSSVGWILKDEPCQDTKPHISPSPFSSQRVSIDRTLRCVERTFLRGVRSTGEISPIGKQETRSTGRALACIERTQE